MKTPLHRVPCMLKSQDALSARSLFVTFGCLEEVDPTVAMSPKQEDILSLIDGRPTSARWSQLHRVPCMLKSQDASFECLQPVCHLWALENVGPVGAVSPKKKEDVDRRRILQSIFGKVGRGVHGLH